MEKESVCGYFELHPKRNLCAHCYHPKEDHAFDEEDISGLKSLLENVAKEHKCPEPESSSIYSWIPPRCPPDRYDDYFRQLPGECVPKIKSMGEKARLKRLFKQIPLTDLSESTCRFVEGDCLQDLKSFIQNLKNKHLKFGLVMEWETSMPLQCPKCLVLFDERELVVMPSTLSLQAFHVACFVCKKCQEYLSDLVHCLDERGSVFCVRHFSETIRKRCHTCDELIFALRYAQARDQFYHREHLFCFSPDCETPLEDNKGFEKDGELYCIQCYQENFGDDCDTCGKSISVDSKHVTYEGKCYHMTCFTCEKCQNTLSDFEVYEGKFYCVECFNKDFAPRCKECGEIFEGEVKVIKYDDNIYHVNCFRCFDCRRPIGSESFIPNEDRIFCKQCHLRNFGIKCIRCKYAITDNHGIMHHKQPFHASCFTCENCSARLADMPFKTVDQKWYCMNCSEKTAGKQCQACGKSIQLGQNDIIYSYEGYRWHSKCFICKLCGHSLADTSFAIRGADLVCQKCSSREVTATAAVQSAKPVT